MLDVPLVQTRQAHGDTFPTEDHAAFHFDFATHVEGASLWQGLTEMADHLGEPQKAAEYLALFEKGRRWTAEHLFNGQYFIQQVDVTDHTLIERYGGEKYWNSECGEIKYQIGEGCAIDQLLGQWHANICGLGDIFDQSQRQTALKSMMRNNFKDSLRNFANMWRVFALNDEGGAVMCDYPDGSIKQQETDIYLDCLVNVSDRMVETI